MKILLFGLLLATALQLSARPFTSADGKRTMEATLISYTPSTDTVVLQISGQGNRTTAKASAFSKSDQEFFNEFHKEAEKFNALKVSVKEESEKFENKTGIYIYEQKKEHFVVSIDNRSEFDLDGLTAKYDVYVSKFNKDGKKIIEVVSGTEAIGSINGGSNGQFETKPITINIDCETTSSCPKCVKHAASVERERVIGLRVTVTNSKDEVLTEYFSSNTARATANKHDSES